MRLRIILIAVSLAFLSSFIATKPAKAGFVASVTGAAQVIAPPLSSLPGALLSNDYQVWDESSGTLSSNLRVNQSGQAGNFDGLSNYFALASVIPAGTAYESVMIQLDPSTKFPAQAPVATITFTNKIIGLELFGRHLDASDIYGNPTTIYPHGLPNLFLQTRGIDFTHNDRFSISSDGKSLTLQLTAGFLGFDQIRVFTEAVASNVPEPASLAVWSGIALLCGLRRRQLPGFGALACRLGRVAGRNETRVAAR